MKTIKISNSYNVFHYNNQTYKNHGFNNFLTERIGYRYNDNKKGFYLIKYPS